MTSTAYIGLGSNMGDRLAHLRFAVAQLIALPDVTSCTISPVYQTPALVKPGQAAGDDYLNAVVKVALRRPPFDLLQLGQQWEAQAGRQDTDTRATWAPRPLDIDILGYQLDGGWFSSPLPHLLLPHPGCLERWFVLKPLLDIISDSTWYDTDIASLTHICTRLHAQAGTVFITGDWHLDKA